MPRIVDKDKKRIQILRSSLCVLAKKGLSYTIISDIANAADIGTGTFYEYFKSKEEIMPATLQLFTQDVEDTLAKRLFRMYDLLEKLRTYFQVIFEKLLDDNFEYTKILIDFMVEGIRNKEGASLETLNKFYSDTRNMLAPILDECIAQNKTFPLTYHGLHPHRCFRWTFSAMDTQ